MESLLAVPVGAFLLLWGLLWEPKPKTKKDLKAESALLASGEVDDFGDDNDFDVFASLTSKQQRNYLRRIAQRVLLLLFGVVVLTIGTIREAGQVHDTDAFLLLFGLYAGSMLIVQRAEKASRLLVLFTMAFVGNLLWRTAIFYDYQAENAWAVLAAVAANGLFWLLIGQRFPPGSSDSIEVIGMEG